MSDPRLPISSSVSVLVPSWRRPASLQRCVRAINLQTRPADQIIVTIREDDADTWAVIPDLRRELGDVLQPVSTPAVNLTTAMNLGLAQTTGSLVALTDDDAEPHPDWLAKLEAAFTSPAIGCVGGRDWQPHERWDEPVVGTLSWYGRVVGNHHLGVGPAREVELLKGVNCCFRGDVLRRIGFDKRLRGKGNVSHWEMALCFAFLREGYKLIYDPAIAVDHHIELRHDGDVNARGGFERSSYVDSVHNEVVATHEALPDWARPLHLVWRWSVGTTASPGLLQVVRRAFWLRETLSRVWARRCAACHGTALAMQTLRAVRQSHEHLNPEISCDS